MPRKAQWPPPVYTRNGVWILRVWTNGTPRDYTLGPAGSEEALLEKRRILLELEAARHQAVLGDQEITVSELFSAWLDYAKTYYQTATTPRKSLRVAQVLVELYGRCKVSDFGPLALKAVRQSWIEEGLARTYCNTLTGLVRKIFRWGVGEELVAVEISQRLDAVPDLRKRYTEAVEHAPVQPVPQEVLFATLPYLVPQVRSMILTQLYTGCRPGEVVVMRTCDLDLEWGTVGQTPVWLYSLDEHKTDWHGIPCWIPIGPKAQEVLRPYLEGRQSEEYLFSPREAKEWKMAQRRQSRKVKRWPSHAVERRRKKKPRLRPGERYTPSSYCRAIARACEKGGLQHWSPNQIRHLAGTIVLVETDQDGARCVLRHRTPSVTARYAVDLEKAARIVADLG